MESSNEDSLTERSKTLINKLRNRRFLIPPYEALSVEQDQKVNIYFLLDFLRYEQMTLQLFIEYPVPTNANKIS
jgi:hypothetical protein